ncbi:FixH family protein [Gammaproteobacteria bacterium AS21]|jgi:hypothetical protein
MKTQEQYANDPWYKQPWLLIALIPLVATVIAGTTFLVVSIVSSDGIVKDDYYRMARGYYSDPSKKQQAYDNKLAASVFIDNVTGDLSVKLSGDITQLPEMLSLDFVSPTHQKYDINASLRQVSGEAFYLGSLSAPLNGKHYLMLAPKDDNWRLSTEITPPYEQVTIELKAEKPQ